MPLNPYYISYIVVLAGSVIIAFLLLIRVWWLRTMPGAYGLTMGILCAAWWSFCYIFEIARRDMQEKIFWGKLEYFGISFISLGLFIFALHYVGLGKWLTRPRLFILSAPAFLNLFLALTNDSHGLMWAGVSFTNNNPFGPLAIEHGGAFNYLIAYQYTLILAATLLFIQVVARGQNLYRNQSLFMLIGLSAPWIANILYISEATPFPSLDLTPIAITFTNIALSLSFLRYRLMDLQPVAQSSVFNAMKDGVIVLDFKDRIVDINPVGTFIFQDTGNVLGENIQSLLPEWKDWHASNPAGEISREIKVDLAGDSLVFSLRTTSVMDPRGKRTGRILLLSDITEQKKANEQLLEVSRMKSQLLANLGHDLRSPLGAIVGYAEMLNEGTFGKVNEDQQKAASEILDSANQLLSFINNLVGQAQMETGKILLREHPVAIAELVGPLMSTLNFHARKKGIALKETIDPALPPRILGDQFWLRQIVLNLVHNAVKFTEQGSVHLSFSKVDDSHWAIRVADTGMGIPPDAQKRVFEAFEQIDKVEVAKQSGFGLGLSIVAKLTAVMEGKIDLKSAEGKGAVFTITLPLKKT